MTRNSLERRKVFLGRLASLSVIAFVVALALLSVACNNVNLTGKGSGTVSLAIGDVLTKSVRSAGEPLRQTLATGAEYTVEARLSGGHTARTSITVDSGNLAGAALSFEGIPVGVTVRLDLEVRAGNNLVWIGSTVDDYTVESGENPLTVNVGRVSGVLLWKLNVDSGNHDILTAPYGAYDSPAETKITFGASDSSQGTPFCFDGDGNLYVMPSDDQTLSEVKQYDLQPNGTYKDSNTNISTNGEVFNHLAYDSVAGILYGIGEKAGLYYSKSNGNFEPVQGDTVNTGSCLGLAAHDNVVYCAETGLEEGSNGEIMVSLSRYDLSSDSSSKQGETIHHQLSEVFGTDVSTLTGQMIYQDGALYLSIGSLGLSGDAGYSIGAVVKINAATLAIEESFGQNGYLGLFDSSEGINGKKCFAPTEEYEGTRFYGPMGFVAVMPKKLVLADSGYAMSAYGTDSVKLSKKSRIVTIDLETEAFESVSVDGYYEPTYLTGCGFVN